jgi:pilus assembly protein CpaB
MLPVMLSVALAQPTYEVLTKVPVARHDLAPGTALEPSDVRERPFMIDLIPNDTMRQVSWLEGRVVRQTIFKGELIREARLAPEGSAPGLPGALPPGRTLVRLEPTLAAPLVVPGDLVDVIDGKRFCVVVEAAIVLGLEDADGEVHMREAPKTLDAWHLAVTPVQSQLLFGVGSYTLALRGVIDREPLAEGLMCPKG